MAFNSEPNEGSRKTLDEIRRELEAEYEHSELADPAPEAEREPRRGDARREPRIAQGSTEREDVDEDTFDERLARFQEFSDRHQRAMGHRRDAAEGGPRRSGYLIAAVVGCVVGQALLLGFLMVTRNGGWLDASRTSAVVARGSEVPIAAAPIQPAVPAASGPQADPPPRPSDDLPPRVAQEPPVPSPLPPSVVSTATVRESVPPRAAPEPRQAPARLPGVAGAKDWAESQARLRTALNEWLRTSARGGAPVQTTEPVIVLGPDGRTAKTYVSVASPIGLIPREQRWELGARGWSLVNDRQAGLPMPAPATAGKER